MSTAPLPRCWFLTPEGALSDCGNGSCPGFLFPLLSRCQAQIGIWEARVLEYKCCREGYPGKSLLGRRCDTSLFFVRPRPQVSQAWWTGPGGETRDLRQKRVQRLCFLSKSRREPTHQQRREGTGGLCYP